MYARIIFLFGLLIYSISIEAQTIYGLNNYTEYRIGTLPIVLSAPHGGLIAPANIADRTCNSPTTVTDANTIQLLREIDTALFNLTGCRPHLIICNLKRTKLDCNRNLADGACGDPNAGNAWQEFHHFIDTAEYLAQQGNPKAFYIDLHGHGHPIQRLEIGYLLTAVDLGYSDATLNTTQFIDSSSIKNLVSTNVNGYTHAQLVRGSYALGTMLGHAGYAAVPSQQIPSPGTVNPYFDGGYNTLTYTSYANGNTINGLQIECNDSNVRDTYISRKKFGDSLAVVLLRYMQKHLNVNYTNCNSITNVEQIKRNEFAIYPNLLNQANEITITPNNNTEITYEISNSLGQVIQSGNTTSNKIRVNSTMTNGIYFITLNRSQTFKFILSY